MQSCHGAPGVVCASVPSEAAPACVFLGIRWSKNNITLGRGAAAREGARS